MTAQPLREQVEGNARMPATLWTLVLTARDLNSPNAQGALAKLCEVYWYPLYAFVRRQGHPHHQAQDLTQGFFEHLLGQQDWLRSVDKEKGRFRTFVLTALSNYLKNEWVRQSALKRGGGATNFVSWDAENAEARMANEPASETNPGAEFDRLWSSVLVETAYEILRLEYERCGKAALFTTLSPYLTKPVPAGLYAEAKVSVAMSEGALRTAMSRMIRRFGELLREQVGQTVEHPDGVDEELRAVLRSWGGETVK